MKLQVSLASDGIDKQFVSEQDCGPYVLRNEIWTMHFDPSTPVQVRAAYTHDGAYIGDEKTAKFLCDKFNITPEVSKPGHTVCSIGKSADGKWYGWSHRAIYGFKIGDKVKPGDCGYNPKVGTYTIETEDQAKQAAKDFAESVSSSTSTSSFAQRPEEKKIVNYLQYAKHDPHYEGNQYANSYQCSRWSPALLRQLIVFGWQPQEGLYPDRHGTYHLIHDNDEICAVYPSGHIFLIEFPRVA